MIMVMLVELIILIMTPQINQICFSMYVVMELQIFRVEAYPTCLLLHQGESCSSLGSSCVVVLWSPIKTAL